MFNSIRITFICFLFVAISTHADFSVIDAAGDDKGAGDILYPVNRAFTEGELDLVKFEVKKLEGSHQLIFQLKKPLTSPDNFISNLGGTYLSDILKHDFFTINIDVYIDTDRKVGSGFNRTLSGRQVLLANEFAWEKAIIITPRPYASRSKHSDYLYQSRIEKLSESVDKLDSEVSTKIKQDTQIEIQEHYLFATSIKVKRNKIVVTIPDSFINDFSEDWAYCVLISAATPETSFQFGIEAPNYNLLTQPGRSKDNLGLKSGARRNAAPIVDMLDTHQTQKIWLNNLLLDEKSERYFSVVGGVVPSAVNQRYEGTLTKPDVFTVESDASVVKQPRVEKDNLTLEQRLTRLQRLLDNKLISKDEFNRIRQKIIDSL